MSYKQYLIEHETRLYSDPIQSTDEYMYTNARALELYGHGKRFQIEDNSLLYEVIKIFKDVIDRHFYQNQIRTSIQIADKSVIFTLLIAKDDVKFSYFVETIYMFIATQIFKQFGKYFEISREDDVSEDNNVILKIKVTKVADEDK